MLLIARTTEALTIEECDLRALISASPRTAPRPTDQHSGELKGLALEAFAAPCLPDAEDEDIAFSPVPDDARGASPLSHPAAPPPTSPHSLPSQGDPPMHFKHLDHGSSLAHLTTTDLALLALVLRHAASNEDLLRLNPLLPTTLDSLASAFETATLMGLQQAGHVETLPDTPLTAEQVQAWCQRVVVGDIAKRRAPTYSVPAPNAPGPSED